MKPDDRYKMACVDLYSAKQRLERIIGQYEKENHVPSSDMMAACIQDISSAMVKVARSQMSDPRYRAPTPGCEAGCGMEGEYRVCLSHSVDVEPHR